MNTYARRYNTSAVGVGGMGSAACYELARRRAFRLSGRRGGGRGRGATLPCQPDGQRVESANARYWQAEDAPLFW